MCTVPGGVITLKLPKYGRRAKFLPPAVTCWGWGGLAVAIRNILQQRPHERSFKAFELGRSNNPKTDAASVEPPAASKEGRDGPATNRT